MFPSLRVRVELHRGGDRIREARRKGRRRRGADRHALLQQADREGLYQHYKAINDAVGIPSSSITFRLVP